MIDIATAIAGHFELPPWLSSLLPDQGCIEIQQDTPGKLHDWHAHAHDETLVVLTGELHFSADTGERVFGSGDVIALPARTRHRSVAGPEGSRYVIVFADVMALLSGVQGHE